jgi:hypothetical protein
MSAELLDLTDEFSLQAERDAEANRAQVMSVSHPFAILTGRLFLGVASLELLYPALSIYKLLLSCVERMADVADGDVNSLKGGAGLESVPAGAGDCAVIIMWMNLSLHLLAFSVRRRPGRV